MTINLNTDPYFDDYSEDKKFYKILFRPGYPVQARELTQLQTILQKQISRHGDAIFKNGAMVIPGQTSIEFDVDYVKVQNTFSGSDVSQYLSTFLGTTVTGTSGIAGIVFHVQTAEGADPHTLYIKYTRAANDNVTKVFAASEVITNGTNSVTALASSPTGTGTIVSIQKGVYYYNGFFVLVEEQKLVLEKYNAVAPSYRIGLRANEKLISPEDDETLLDNAQNSYNFAAPGAHRHFIEMKLEKLAINSTDDVDFINLAVVENGALKRDTRISELSELEKTLARRTYDESGSYTVRNFEIDVREYRDNNRGAWVTGTPYLEGDVVTHSGKTWACVTAGVSSAAPTTTSGFGTLVTDGTLVWEYVQFPEYNRGIFAPLASETTLQAHRDNEAKLAVGLEPGKAYVQGFEIEKIATEFVAVPKARTTNATTINNATVTANVGAYSLVGSVFGLPTPFTPVNLYDRQVATPGTAPAGASFMGTARVRGYEFHSSGIYKIFLFDIFMVSGKSFERHVKSYHAGSVSGNFDHVYTQLVGSVTTNSASTTVTGNGTSFQTDLIVGDYIRVGGTVLGQIATITSQTSLTLTANASATVTNGAYTLARIKVYEPANSSMVFPLPTFATNTLQDVQYQVMETLPGATADGSGNVSLTYSGSGTLTSPLNATNYFFLSNSTAFVPASVNVSGNTITATGFPAAAAVICQATIQYTGVLGTTEKTKTLATQQTTFSTAAAANSLLVLDKADGYKLARVEMDTAFAFGGSPTFLSANVVDITDRYDFNNGQTESYYGPCTLKLKGSYSPPTSPIRVTFQYFQHGAGHFFSKNSYSIDYKKIPFFRGIALRDALDFRPRIDVVANGMSGTLPVKRGVNPTVDVTYYLPRKDRVGISSNGRFFVAQGSPDLTPREPSTNEADMILYGLTLEPYTFSSKYPGVIISRNDNKRYTMRDVGKLEKRIQNLEYYTSLSLLEQETDAMRVRDANGLDRFKNGFVVDGFSNAGIGDRKSADFTCSIDTATGQLRPHFSVRNVNLIESASSDAARAASNYKVWGDLVTLPLHSTVPHVALVKQPMATRLENINPFAVFGFNGHVELNPAADEWYEERRNPDIVQNDGGSFTPLTSALAWGGVMGSQWNSWQSQWSGVPSTITTATPRWDGGLSTSAINTETTSETYQTFIGQARSGIYNNVSPNVVTASMGDRSLSTAVIPYIRSRHVLVQAKRLKPNTRFYPFFDGIDVQAYCTPTIHLQYNLNAGSKDVDVDSNVGVNQTQAARLIDGNSISALNKGDLVTFANGATAVVVNKYISGGLKWMEVANVKGTIVNGQNFSGSVQDASLNVAQGTIISSTNPTTFISNNAGDLNLLFKIPSSDAVRFRTGVREFLLLDTSTYNGQPTSRARAQYFAQGILETKQDTIISTRQGFVSSQAGGDLRTIVQTSDRITSNTFQQIRTTPGIGTGGGGGLSTSTNLPWPTPTVDVGDGTGFGSADPLAQTFFVQQRGGCFLTKVDIFFATKAANIPVTLEIREVVNGYPGNRVLPFSRVTLKPDQVSISATNVQLNGASVASYDTPTSFNFSSPVYVEDGKQYAIVLMADTQEYTVWISQMGERIPATDRVVSDQPNLGFLFKSQNASVWAPDKTQDLMFTLYRANFNIGSTGAPTQGSVRFVNDELPAPFLPANPFEVRSGQTLVRVHAPDHGLISTSHVTLAEHRVGTGLLSANGASATVTLTGGSFTTMGIVAGSLLYNSNGVYVGKVLSVQTATSLTLTTVAQMLVLAEPFLFAQAVAGIPADQLYTTHTTLTNIQPDSFVITVGTAATSTGYVGGDRIRSTRNNQFDVMQPVVQSITFPETSISYSATTAVGLPNNGFAVETAYPVSPNDNNYMKAPRYVLSKVEETNKISGAKSFKLDMVMQSSNPALSPVIDTGRVSLITVSNRLNISESQFFNVGALDSTTIVSNNLIQLTGSAIFSADTATKNLLNSIPIGREVVVAGAANGANNGTYLVTDYREDGDGIYVNKSAFVTQASGVSTITITALGNYLAENTPTGSSGLSKYVTKRINFANASTLLRISFSLSLPEGGRIGIYYRLNPVGNTGDIGKRPWIEVASDGPVPVVAVGSNDFYEITATASNLIPFDGMQLKIALFSNNTSATPRCKDLRIIACA
jgi:hypothetical protein